VRRETVATMKPGSIDATLLLRRALAEFIGTALLLIVVIGSGIAAQSLSPTDVGLGPRPERGKGLPVTLRVGVG
jgi:glycerol uptake facilitator-like aquaporin